jgi:hypothetical protein
LSSIEGLLTGGVVGVAIGDSASSALEPVFEPITQDAWFNAAHKLLNENQLAQLVAEALLESGPAQQEAQRHGFAAVEFNKLVQLALKAPGTPQAEHMYLRKQGGYPGSITQTQLNHAYAKAGIEFQYWAPLTAAAQNTLLTPAELALAVVRSTVESSGLLVVELDTSNSNVPKYPVAALDTVAEFAAAGVDRERARVMVGAIGLPMSTHEAASAYFRNIITLGAFNQSILEGDVRPEWAPYILDQAREILTAHDWVEGFLRGWVPTAAEMYAGTALHGMSQADTDLLFKITGRPLAIHQITTGLARGGTFGGFYEGVPDPYLSAVRESNIRPEYGNLDYANRYTYPSGFQIKAEATAGVLDEATTEMLLLQVGWSPEWAAFFAKAWSSQATKTNKHVSSSTTTLVTAARKAYVGGAANQAQTVTALNAAGLETGVQTQLFTLWDAQRTLEALPAPTVPL